MTEDRNDEGRMPDGQRVPLPLKLFGALCVLGGLASLGDLVPVAVSLVQGLGGAGYRTASVAIFAALMAVLAVSAVLFVFLGVRLLLNRRKHAAATANTLAALTVLSIIGTLMPVSYTHLTSARLTAKRTRTRRTSSRFLRSSLKTTAALSRKGRGRWLTTATTVF